MGRDRHRLLEEREVKIKWFFEFEWNPLSCNIKLFEFWMAHHQNLFLSKTYIALFPKSSSGLSTVRVGTAVRAAIRCFRRNCETLDFCHRLNRAKQERLCGRFLWLWSIRTLVFCHPTLWPDVSIHEGNRLQSMSQRLLLHRKILAKRLK